MQFLRTSTCIWTYHLKHKQTNYTSQSMIKPYEKNWIKIKTPNLTQQRSNKSNQISCSSCPKTRNLEKFKQQKWNSSCPKTRNLEKLKTKKSLNNKNWNSSCPKTANPENFKQQKLKLLMPKKKKNWKPRKIQKLET